MKRYTRAVLAGIVAGSLAAVVWTVVSAPILRSQAAPSRNA